MTNFEDPSKPENHAPVSAIALAWVVALLTSSLGDILWFELSGAVPLWLLWAKMGLLAAILLLELRPMITLMRWRRVVGRGDVPDTNVARGLARTSFLQATLVVLMVLAATALARGYGVPAR